VLGFDYGSKRIGVAVGHELTKHASALATLNLTSQQIDWNSLDQIVADWQPQALVVGLPLNADATEHALTRVVKQFGDQLQKRYNLPVFWQDERLTSHEAQRIIAASQSGDSMRTRRKRKPKTGEVDRTAAMLILESWFNR